MSIKIIYKEQNEKEFWKYWEEIIRNASYRYFRTNLSTFNYGDKNDKSFVYIVNNKPIAGAFLPLDKIDKSYINAPLVRDKSVEKEIFKIIDQIAIKNKLEKIMFEIDPLEQESYNYLQKYDYLDSSILEYVIDLSDDDLLAGCRKGCRNDIKNVLKDKDFIVFYIDKDNASYEIHEEYRRLHHKCSGRATRDKKTFDWQFKRIEDGKAVLFGLKYKNKNIAFSYFEFNAGKAVYYSSADDPDYDKMHLYHVLLFSAMGYLKKKGVHYVDTTQPSCPAPQFDYYPDKKQLNIALFKRGFGGDYMNNYRGIKYFSKKRFEKDLNNFINFYKGIIN